MNRKSLGQRIKKYRLERGLTAETFAEKIELSTSMVREIERGSRLPSLGTLVKIANTLGVSADELLCDSINKSSHVSINEMFIDLNSLEAADIAMIKSIVGIMAEELHKRSVRTLR